MSHSSHKLSELRANLTEINQKLLTTIKERRALVHEIQQCKESTQNPFSSYDSARESELFARMRHDLLELSDSELLAFSILMEAQAGAPERYPAWSSGVHLLEAPQSVMHQLNPLLVKLLSPTSFDALKLTTHFSFLRSI
ncbi:MAG: chorismate mutase [Bacteriovoracia bacterium]